MKLKETLNQVTPQVGVIINNFKKISAMKEEIRNGLVTDGLFLNNMFQEITPKEMLLYKKDKTRITISRYGLMSYGYYQKTPERCENKWIFDNAKELTGVCNTKLKDMGRLKPQNQIETDMVKLVIDVFVRIKEIVELVILCYPLLNNLNKIKNEVNAPIDSFKYKLKQPIKIKIYSSIRSMYDYKDGTNIEGAFFKNAEEYTIEYILVENESFGYDHLRLRPIKLTHYLTIDENYHPFLTAQIDAPFPM